MSGGQTQEQEEEAESGDIYGVWQSNEAFDIKGLILSNIDSVMGMAEIELLKESKANGITITQDGMAYCTYNGKTIDYAKFTCGIVDESTVHLQWSYTGSYVNAGVGVGIASVGINTPSTYEAGFDVKYRVEGNTLYLEFPGMSLELYK